MEKVTHDQGTVTVTRWVLGLGLLVLLGIGLALAAQATEEAERAACEGDLGGTYERTARNEAVCVQPQPQASASGSLAPR